MLVSVHVESGLDVGDTFVGEPGLEEGLDLAGAQDECLVAFRALALRDVEGEIGVCIEGLWCCGGVVVACCCAGITACSRATVVIFVRHGKYYELQEEEQEVDAECKSFT